mmetsp:Transcript_99585/g.214856  ORF Transcript_99585/g.214856 Transcript_99585/m.214856 type:complete len:387 (-) Transcript_99585:266-1426(-)
MDGLLALQHGLQPLRALGDLRHGRHVALAVVGRRGRGGRRPGGAGPGRGLDSCRQLLRLWRQGGEGLHQGALHLVQGHRARPLVHHVRDPDADVGHAELHGHQLVVPGVRGLLELDERGPLLGAEEVGEAGAVRPDDDVRGREHPARRRGIGNLQVRERLHIPQPEHLLDDVHHLVMVHDHARDVPGLLVPPHDEHLQGGRLGRKVVLAIQSGHRLVKLLLRAADDRGIGAYPLVGARVVRGEVDHLRVPPPIDHPGRLHRGALDPRHAGPGLAHLVDHAGVEERPLFVDHVRVLPPHPHQARESVHEEVVVGAPLRLGEDDDGVQRASRDLPRAVDLRLQPARQAALLARPGRMLDAEAPEEAVALLAAPRNGVPDAGAVRVAAA